MPKRREDEKRRTGMNGTGMKIDVKEIDLTISIVL